MTNSPLTQEIRVGVYARISDDSEGDMLGVKRQCRDGDLIAKVRNWTVHDHYIDDDLSASKWSIQRPGFLRLIQDLESGVIQGIVGYDIDRLFRLPIDLERTIKIYDYKDDLVFATVQGDINLSSDDGITMARVMVAFANKESRNISRRVKAKHAELARTGVPVSGSRPFGWKASPETLQAAAVARLQGNDAAIAAAEAQVRHEERRRVDPFESQLILDGANDILAGHGVYELAQRWNDLGYKTPKGNPWRQQVVRTLYMSPRLAGYRVHKGQIAYDDLGLPVKGQYDKVLDEGVWRAVCKELEDRAKTRSRPARRRYQSSGLLRCGICSFKLRANNIAKYGYHFYVCPPKNSGGGCGKIGIHGPQTDKHLELLWKAYVSLIDGDAEAQPWPREHEIAEKEEQIAELMEAFRLKQITGPRVFPVIQAIETELQGLRNEQAAWIQAERKFSEQSLNTADWDSMTVTERRVELAQHFQAVMIHPLPKGAPPRFDPARIEPIWHERSAGSSAAALHPALAELTPDTWQATLQSSSN